MRIFHSLFNLLALEEEIDSDRDRLIGNVVALMDANELSCVDLRFALFGRHIVIHDDLDQAF